MKYWKITIGQLAPSLLNLTTNTRKVLALLDECSRRGSNLLVLPELYLTGYDISSISTPEDREAFIHDIKHSLEEIRLKTLQTGTDVIISYPLFTQNAGKPYIASEYAANGKTLAIHKKINLCNYAQYTEHLNFCAGEDVTVVKTSRGGAGILICEDLWHVTNALFAAQNGADAIFYSSAANVLKKEDGPACVANWEKLTVGTAFAQTSYVICCNQATTQDTLFLGASHVVDPNGDIVLRMPLYAECVTDLTLDMIYLQKVRSMRPLLKNERLNIYRKYLK